ncbi:immunoglobulin superfamily member 3-like isoform X1 [Entelurus aequoreus]|uniref:immunoglobulin superfamily member 3-like isoform X1 n=2 Tax=Entelurus aequoreus TaxID=161455 RepID=UPI002B1DE884|nr:immunoglobulin superfamily member 3-like isoform X1 [Entelurus aequoreus]
MLSSLSSFWTSSLLFCMGPLLHCGEAEVLTKVQAGPLYRMAGSRLSISCNVSGFIDVSFQKDFQFRVTKPITAKELNIISTSDPQFGYTVYRNRGNNITLSHVTPNSVLFEIQSLRKDDEGKYNCFVVNPYSVYEGTYDATTDVKVIDNSLSVSSTDLTRLSHNEGEALTLTCRVSSDTIQHTHLSVAWYVHRENQDNAQLILSLDRDFTLRPGQEFQGRYQAGFIRLDKVGGATYRLTMEQLEVSDRGRVYCQAQEWIQDPDLSWYSLALKTAGETTLDVKGRELVPDKSSVVVVRLSAQQLSLQEGQELLLTCSVDTQNLEEKLFSVAWHRAGVEMARIGPTGVLSVRPEYSWREKQGELRASRIGDGDYRLVLQPVSTDDQGEYMCRVWPQERGQRGAFVQGAAQDSISLQASISATESDLSLTCTPALITNINSDITIKCSVASSRPGLSRYAVTWILQKPAQNVIIASSDRDASVKFGPTVNVVHGQRISVRRTEGPSFELTIRDTETSDQGAYVCEVVEWLQNSRGKWHRLTSAYRSTQLTLSKPVNDLRLDTTETWLSAREGDEVQLKCDLITETSGPPLFYQLTWFYTRRGSPAVNNQLLELDRSGMLRYPSNEGLHGLQRRLRLSRHKPSSFGLEIQRVHERDSGTYHCRVEQYQLGLHGQWQQKASVDGVPIMLSVNVTDNNLSIIQKELEFNVSTEQNFTIPCHVGSRSSQESKFQVTWFWQEESHSTRYPLFTSYRNSTLHDRAGWGERLRRIFGHDSPNHFALTVSKPTLAESGLYSCEVQEWLPTLSHGWRKVGVENSGYSTVTVYSQGQNDPLSGCYSGMLIGVFVAIVLCFLLVIFVLVLKLKRAKASSKKSGQSLWKEQHHLKRRTEEL